MATKILLSTVIITELLFCVPANMILFDDATKEEMEPLMINSLGVGDRAQK